MKQLTSHIDSIKHPKPIKISDFNKYKGTRECYGHIGIRNLFSLLKADVKAACDAHGIYLPKRSGKLKELQSLIIPFNESWQQWTKSSFCNLSEFEISLISLYREKQDYEFIARKLQVSYDVLLSTMAKTVLKLKSPQSQMLLQKWKDFKHLDAKNSDDFLEIPLEGLHHVFPARVFRLLQNFGNNMNEVLNNITVKELRKYKNFGKKAEDELRAILEEHHCLHLLKP